MNDGCLQLTWKRQLSSPLLMQGQCKDNQYVCVSTDFYGKYQSEDEAKHNICSVFNDISNFQR